MVKRVLVVEDDEDMAGLIVVALADEGYEVCLIDRPTHTEEHRLSWDETLENQLKAHPCDLVLMDLQLANEDRGCAPAEWTGCRLAQHLAGCRSAPVIVLMSAAPTWRQIIPDLKGRGVIRDFIAKPFDVETLLKTVQQALQIREEGSLTHTLT